MLAPLWCVTETSDKEEANVIWSTVVAQVMIASELLGGDPVIAKRIRRVYEEAPCSAWVRFPVLLNTKTLTRGDVLRVFAKKTSPNREENWPDIYRAGREEG